MRSFFITQHKQVKEEGNSFFFLLLHVSFLSPTVHHLLALQAATATAVLPSSGHHLLPNSGHQCAPCRSPTTTRLTFPCSCWSVCCCQFVLAVRSCYPTPTGSQASTQAISGHLLQPRYPLATLSFLQTAP